MFCLKNKIIKNSQGYTIKNVLIGTTDCSGPCNGTQSRHETNDYN